MKNTLVFDIETYPLPEAELEPHIPKKFGRFTDPEKVRPAFIDAATLDARFSRIYAAGISTGPIGCLVMHHPNPTEEQERSIIETLWARIRIEIERRGTVAGWNIHGFDLLFLYQRSKILNILTPPIRVPLYRNEWTLDLMEQWNLGRGYTKLDDVAKVFGFEGKIDLGGKLPWQVEPELSLAYTRQDIEITWKVMERLR